MRVSLPSPVRPQIAGWWRLPVDLHVASSRQKSGWMGFGICLGPSWFDSSWFLSVVHSLSLCGVGLLS